LAKSQGNLRCVVLHLIQTLEEAGDEPIGDDEGTVYLVAP
jgi:hypothetical protein